LESGAVRHAAARILAELGPEPEPAPLSDADIKEILSKALADPKLHKWPKLREAIETGPLHTVLSDVTQSDDSIDGADDKEQPADGEKPADADNEKPGAFAVEVDTFADEGPQSPAFAALLEEAKALKPGDMGSILGLLAKAAGLHLSEPEADALVKAVHKSTGLTITALRKTLKKLQEKAQEDEWNARRNATGPGPRRRLSGSGKGRRSASVYGPHARESPRARCCSLAWRP
jgi:hypothetical protein